jgi:two-component system, OmpR family, sensor kinase
MSVLRTAWVQFFLAIILVGALPVGVLSVGIATVERQVIAEQSATELTGMARGLASHLDVYLAAQLAGSRAMASISDIVSMEPARQEAAIKDLFHHYSDLTRLSTFDLSGRRLASSSTGGVTSIETQRAFQAAVQRRQQVWEIAPSPSTGRPSLLIFTPIRAADRQVVGILGAVIDLETLSGTFERVPVDGGRRAFVVDGYGQVVAHPDEAAVSERRHLPWLGLFDGGRVPGPGTTRYTNEGERRVAGFAPVPVSGWVVVVDRLEADVMAPAEQTYRFALAAIGLSLLLAAIGSLILARTITRPIRQLAAAARTIGAGDLAVRLPVSPHGGEVGTLVASFEEMRQRLLARTAERERAETALREAIKAREEFLSVAAHELKTPMTLLLGMVQLTQRRLSTEGMPDPSRLNRTLNTLNEQSLRASRLMNQLFDISRISEGKLVLEPQVTDLPALVERMVGMARLQSSMHDIELQLPDEPLPVLIDPIRIEQVLVNLLDNAVKYSPDGGRIDVRVIPTPDRVSISVRDHGLGIPPEYHAQVFDRFFQAHTKAYRSGMGLGLYICKQIVEQHGGEIAVEAPADGGTRFTVAIPRVGASTGAGESAPREGGTLLEDAESRRLRLT